MKDTSAKLFCFRSNFFTHEYPPELLGINGDFRIRLFSLLEFGGRLTEVKGFGGEVIMVEFYNFEHLKNCAEKALRKNHTTTEFI